MNNISTTYDVWSTSYDRDHESKSAREVSAVEEMAVSSILRNLHFQTVLDVASGTGRWAIMLAGMGKSVTAIDSSAGMLKKAKQKTKKRGLTVDYIHTPLEGFASSDKKFDLVICCLALIHMEDAKAAISKMLGMVNPGGHLLVSDIHPSLNIPWEEKQTIFVNGSVLHYPVFKHSLDSYTQGVTHSGGRVLAAIDIPVSRLGKITPGALVLLAQPPEKIKHEQA